MTTKHLLAATLVACSLSAQAQVIQTYQVRDAVTLRTPILTDSINTEGRKYETKNLLGTTIVFPAYRRIHRKLPPVK